MRHHNGHAAVPGGETGGALAGTVGVGRVLLGGIAHAVHVAQGHQALLHIAGQVGVADLHPPFAMGHGDGQAGARHVAQQDGWGIADFHQRGAGLELLAQIAHEARPMFRAGHQVLEVGQHLTAVANAQGESVLAEEETVEGVTQAVVIQHGLGPAATSTKHVAIGETATGHQAFHVVQIDVTGQQVAHMHVHGGEAGTVKSGRHLGLAVDALLAQDRHLGPGTADEWRRYVFAHVEGEPHVQAWIIAVRDGVELLAGAVRVVAQRLDTIAGFRPEPLQTATGPLHQDGAAQAYPHHIVHVEPRHGVHTAGQTSVGVALTHRLRLVFRHLQYRTQFLGEQGRHRFRSITGDVVQHDVDADPAGERHFHQGGEQTTVGAIVVGHQLAFRQQRLGHLEEGLQVGGIVQIRRHIADFSKYLRQRRPGQPVTAAAKIHQQQFAGLGGTQLRGHGQVDITDLSEGGDDQRQRRGDTLVDATLIPHCAHGERVLTHRDGDTQLRTQLHAHRLDRIKQRLILARVTGGGHPVGGQADLPEAADVGAGQIGNGFRHRHAAGGGGVHQRHRGALPHGHGFAGSDIGLVGVETGGGHRAVGHRHLPGSHHLVPVNQTGHRPVADGNQEALGGHRGQPQHPIHRIAQFDVVGGESLALEVFPIEGTLHLRRLAEQQVHGQVHWRVAEVLIGHFQVLFLGGFTKHREGRTLAPAQCLEARQVLRHYRQHIAFLGFVAPDFHRAHSRLITGHPAQFQVGATIGIVDQFRQGVGEAAGTDVVDGNNGVVVTQGPAAIDHFLHPPLDFRVTALHRGEIQGLVGFAAGHGTGGTAAETDQQRRATQHDDSGARRNTFLLHVAVTNIAKAAGDHDRLVVTAPFIPIDPRGFDFQGAEIAAQIRTAELVVEGGTAQRPLDHDVKGRGNAPGAAVVVFPRLHEIRNAQIGDREPGKAGLGLGAATGGAFVTDLAASAGGSPGMGGDGGGVVMGLHLHQHMHRLIDVAVLGVVRTGEETVRHRPRHHRGIILIGAQHAFTGVFVGVANHAEQAQFLSLAVNGPVGIEDFVPAMLGVGLGEHHQFRVAGVAPQSGETFHQVIDLVVRQSQTQLAVGPGQRVAASADHIHRGQRLGLMMAEQRLGLLGLIQHRLHHAVMQRRHQLRPGDIRVRPQPIFNAPLHSQHLVEASVMADIGGFGRPGRDRAGARHHQELAAFHLLLADRRAIAQQTVEHRLFLGG